MTKAAAPGFRCPLCGNTASSPVFHFEQGDYHRCAACQLLSLHPMPSPESLLDLYNADYYGDTCETTGGDRPSEIRCVTDAEQHSPMPGCAETEGYKSYAEQRASRIRTFRRYANRIATERPGARVLDVGCALGFFLEAALEHGLDAHGIDASETAIASIRSRFGARVRSGTLASVVQGERGSYDVVFASDLIEHIPEPHGFVGQLAELLAPNGEFLGITPNARSLLATISGRRWVSLKPPEHVILYEPRHLRRLLTPHFGSILVSTALQEYPASLVAARLGELLGPARMLTDRLSSLLGSRSLRVPDGNMIVSATHPRRSA